MDNETYKPSRARLLTTTGASSFDDFVHPKDLTDEQIEIVMKRIGVDKPIALQQYNVLFYERDQPAVKRELERIHAKFVALRLKRSQL